MTRAPNLEREPVLGCPWNIQPPIASGFGVPFHQVTGVTKDGAMPRYCFTVQDSKPAPDTTEIHLSGPEEAHSLAMAEAGEMLRDHADKAWSTSDWWVHVTDEQGTTACRITVSGTA